MTKIGRFLRGFSLVDFSAVGLIFTGKAMHFYGLISKPVVLLIKEEMSRSNVQLL